MSHQNHNNALTGVNTDPPQWALSLTPAVMGNTLNIDNRFRRPRRPRSARHEAAQLEVRGRGSA